MAINPNALRVVVVSVFFACFVPGLPASGLDYKVIALSDVTDPGVGADVVFESLGVPMINRHGEVVFTGALEGGPITSQNRGGLWAYRGGQLEMVLQRGDPVPGTTTGETFADFSDFRLDDGSNIHMGLWTYSGPGIPSRKSMWYDNGNALMPVAWGDMPVAGFGSGHTYNHPTIISAGGTSQISFSSGINVGGTFNGDIGLWVGNPGAPLLLAYNDMPAPASDPGTIIKRLGGGFINHNGSALFTTTLAGPSITSSNDQRLWLHSAGQPQVIATKGDIAPGTSANFFKLMARQINNQEQALFKAELDGAGVDGTNNDGYWLYDQGQIKKIVRESDPVPGFGAGVEFTNITNIALLSGRGDVFFHANLKGTGIDPSNDAAAWRWTDQGIELLAREGGPAPGGAPDERMYGFYLSGANDMGQAVMAGNFLHENGSSTGDSALWLTDQDGSLRLILREGDTIDVNEDPTIEELRIIDRYYLTNPQSPSGGESGQPRPINNAGQLAVNLQFTDGTSAVVVIEVNLPGDFDGDGDVDGVDLAVMFANFNGPGGGVPLTPETDLDGDGDADGVDLAAMFGQFTGPLAPANVPEPGTLALVGLVAVAALQRRHH